MWVEFEDEPRNYNYNNNSINNNNNNNNNNVTARIALSLNGYKSLRRNDKCITIIVAISTENHK